MPTHAKLTSLKGKVAIITGSGGGLGREYALMLASYGAKVVVNDYGGGLSGERGTVTRAQSVVDEIVAAGGEAMPDGHDISIQTEVQAMVSDAVERFGTVHILINNAGIPGAFGNTDGKISVEPGLFLRTIEIAALGTILCTSAVYPFMEKQKYGRIVNTSSDLIFGIGAGGDGGYAASKGAVFALTRDLGRGCEKDGIKINGVLPSASSRMTDLDPVTKKICEDYFKASLVAQFVCALAAEECPVSGELFSVGAGRAARTTLATVPGSNQSSVEGYLENFGQVMGDGESLYAPTGCLDQISYAIRNATGDNLQL